MKEKVIQFGEGGFLRGFVDYFFHKLNEKGLFDGSIVVVQPIEKGLINVLNDQNGEYNLFLRGIENGEVINEHTKITSISRGINPYENYDEYLALAKNPDMRYIISNTTEAGIEFVDTDKITDAPPKAYPAKLTALLYERFKAGLPGFVLMPCELIDNNAGELKKCILKYIELWNLGDEFKNWIETENHFCNTLVDRICTGYPADEVEELTKKIGYEDKLIDTAEIFHLWVIEGNFEAELPFNKAGYNIVWTDDVKPYKKRKVRILNGGHTSMVLAAHLYGLETVGECLGDETVSAFLKKCIFDEIIPTLGNSETDINFGKAVLERFANPFIKHKLLAIALNSVSKFKVRVLPSVMAYYEEKKVLPAALTFSLAALIAFYRTEFANDDAEIMKFMKDADVDAILSKTEYWDADLSFMSEAVNKYYNDICTKGMKEAIKCVL